MSTPFETVNEAACALDDVPALPAVDETPQTDGTPLDDDHQKQIGWLVSRGLAEWDDERKCLRTRTDSLGRMHEELCLKGEFATLTTASSERNCFAYPKPRGSWFVVRYGKGVREHNSWRTSAGGYTVCDFNKPASKTGDTPAARIVRLATENYQFFHSPEGLAYATITKGGGPQTMLVKERAFGHVLRMKFTEATGQVAKNDWMRNALDQLEAIAVEDRPEFPVYVRLGSHGEKIYLDLADVQGRIVEIDEDGWRIVNDAPVRFRRPATMLPLPVPERGGTADMLRPFFNVRDSDWPLLLGALVMCLHPRGAYPIIACVGRAGSAKSTNTRHIQGLVDPSSIVGSGEPESTEALMLRANDNWILVLDNLNVLDQDLSDCLCRLSTGSAFTRRTLYSDAGQTVFRAKRLVVVNSINDVIKAGDLLDRALRFELPALETRKTERQVDAGFDAIRAKALGVLLDGAVSALKHEATTVIDDPPRLYDLAVWATAAEPGLGLDPGAFMAAYRANRADIRGMILENELAREIVALGDFEGTAQELAIQLGWTGLTEQQLRDRVGDLRKLAPALEGEGVTIEFRPRSHGKRLIVIRGASGDRKR
jgi:hypothetical protein